MKKIFTVLAGFSVLALSTVSCQKEEHERQISRVETPQNMTASVPSGQTYTLNLEPGSTANISKQASHFLISEIVTASDGSTVYKYLSAKGFTGIDEVTLQQTITSTSSAGGGCGNDNHEGFQTTTIYKTVVIKFD